MDDLAAVPVVRDRIIKEYADGDLAIRVLVPAEHVDAFWAAFPELHEAAFLGCDEGAVEVVRGQVIAEGRDGGLSVKVLVSPAHKTLFRRLWPRPGAPAVLAREEPSRGRPAMLDAMAAETPLYGPQARILRTHVAFLMNPKIWRAVGTDVQYLSYLRTRPCAHCSMKPHWEIDTFVQCDPAHVRRVGSGAGTAYKPEYSAIPLCRRCHDEQHQYGESEIGGKEWADQARIREVVEWVWETLKAELGYEHWNLVPPDTLRAWAEERGLEEYLPECYRA